MSSAGPAFTLDALLRRSAERGPDRPALVGPDASLTYSELEQAVARTAGALRERGVRPADRVAVWAAKSAAAIVAMYGAMRAGAAYVPIDPSTPDSRALQILEGCDCRVICADPARLERLEAAPPRSAARTLALGLDHLQDFDANVAPVACESDLAYILHTSGSTGSPKGVMLTHRNALAFVEWAAGRFGVHAEDQLVSNAPFHFDLSIFDIYCASLAGATLNLLPAGDESLGASMAAAIRTRGLTVWYSAPSALVLLAAAATPADLTSLRTVLFAGEVFPMKHLRRLRELVPDATLGNLYGPTETNVCTYFSVEGELPPGDDPLPIGHACENQDVFALDDDLQPLADGEVGELWVRGPTVTKGYWANPDETRLRLRQNPLHEDFPDPTYRTGDLVRRLPRDGYAFVGRRDHQVKSRGYRIELGDVERALTRHSLVGEAAVVAVPDERIGSRLIAFVSTDAQLEEVELRLHCSKALPRYMVPAEIEVSAGLPHTTTGKIDRQALTRRAEESG